MSSYADEAKAPGEKQDAKQNSKQSIAAECHGCSTSQQMRVGKPARCTGQAEVKGSRDTTRHPHLLDTWAAPQSAAELHFPPPNCSSFPLPRTARRAGRRTS
ncbi:hypothetical protein E5D57_011280 [Metarhizium anisopliae]|nr:hypothetical protein E5D57_011280 [Metarhizium anisopliae]